MVYRNGMHVIAKSALIDFWTKHPDAKPSLLAWYKIIQGSDFASFVKLRSTFASADHVNGLTVFNIAGNKYRLIAAIHYNRNKVYIRHVLTHAEYDLGKWKKP
jgi:mRNA interferase HigB